MTPLASKPGTNIAPITDITEVKTTTTQNKTKTTESTSTDTLQDCGVQAKVVEKFDQTVKYTTKYPDGRETHEEEKFFNTVEELAKLKDTIPSMEAPIPNQVLGQLRH